MRQPAWVSLRTMVSVVSRSTGLPSWVPVVRPWVRIQAAPSYASVRRLRMVSVMLRM